jgi:hypothetical protein
MNKWELANEATLATPLQGMVKTIAPLYRRRLASNSGTRALLRDGAKKVKASAVPRESDGSPNASGCPARRLTPRLVSPAAKKQGLTVSPGGTAVEKRVNRDPWTGGGWHKSHPLGKKCARVAGDRGGDFGNVLARVGPSHFRTNRDSSNLLRSHRPTRESCNPRAKVIVVVVG